MVIDKVFLFQVSSNLTGWVAFLLGVTAIVGHTWVGCQSSLYPECERICSQLPTREFCRIIPKNPDLIIRAITPVLISVVFLCCGNAIIIYAIVKIHKRASVFGAIILIVAGVCGIAGGGIATNLSINLNGSAFILIWLAAILTLVSGGLAMASGILLAPPIKPKPSSSYEQLP